jgi:hypothetical protein
VFICALMGCLGEELFVVAERMGAHAQLAHSWIIGQAYRNGWGLSASCKLAIQTMTHSGQMGRILTQRRGDGAVQERCAMAVEQLDQSAGQRTQIHATGSGEFEQCRGVVGGMVQAVHGAMSARCACAR